MTTPTTERIVCAFFFFYFQFDAILLGAKRIGHGLSLDIHPALLKRVKDRQIPIDVCPISNKMLHFVKDTHKHPAIMFQKEGIPITISSDNPAMWDVKLLSHDFYEALMGLTSRTDGLIILKEWCLRSIEYSGLSDKEKAVALKKWTELWDKFIDAIAIDYKEYAEDRVRHLRDMIPRGFWAFDAGFSLGQQHRVVFKFGDEENRKYII